MTKVLIVKIYLFWEIKCHEWLGIVFINVNKNKDRFDKVHFSLINRWREFNQKLYFSKNDSEITFNLKCNWKLAVENYCDAYHLPWVHPHLTNILDLKIIMRSMTIIYFLVKEVIIMKLYLKTICLYFLILKIYQKSGS